MAASFCAQRGLKAEEVVRASLSTWETVKNTGFLRKTVAENYGRRSQIAKNLGKSAKAGLEAEEVVRGGGLRGLGRWVGDGGVVIHRVAFVEGETFEDEGGGLVGGLMVEFDVARIREKPLDRRMIEPA